jgi:hypothetical protein
MACNGVTCILYKAPRTPLVGRYFEGQKRCQICGIFIKWEGIFCPCCRTKLRTKPRSNIYRTKLRLARAG